LCGTTATIHGSPYVSERDLINKKDQVLLIVWWSYLATDLGVGGEGGQIMQYIEGHKFTVLGVP